MIVSNEPTNIYSSIDKDLEILSNLIKEPISLTRFIDGTYCISSTSRRGIAEGKDILEVIKNAINTVTIPIIKQWVNEFSMAVPKEAMQIKLNL